MLHIIDSWIMLDRSYRMGHGRIWMFLSSIVGIGLVNVKGEWRLGLRGYWGILGWWICTVLFDGLSQCLFILVNIANVMVYYLKIVGCF